MNKNPNVAADASRRQFIMRSGGLLAFSGLPLSLRAGPALAEPSRSIPAGLALYQPGNADSEHFAAVLERAGLPVVALQPDPVRQWRQGLGRRVEEQQLSLLGLTSWADYFMIRELALEQHKFPLLSMRHLTATQDRGWAEEHAVQLLRHVSLWNSSDLAEVLAEGTALPASTQNSGRGASLFRWLIS